MSLIIQLITNAASMDESELRQLNSVVVSELKRRNDLKQHMAKATLKVGDNVQFMSKYGMQKGVITRDSRGDGEHE